MVVKVKHPVIHSDFIQEIGSPSKYAKLSMCFISVTHVHFFFCFHPICLTDLSLGIHINSQAVP